MRILFQIPYINTLYAGRTIYYGYKHALENLGHKFGSVTASDNFTEKLDRFKPDILITSLNPYHLKYMDLGDIKRHKKRGLKVFVNTPFWKSPISKLRINENISDIIQSITHLLKDPVNQEYRNNASYFAESFNYNNIFKKLL